MTDIEKAREMPSEKSMEKAAELCASRKEGQPFIIERIAAALDSAIAETREEMAKIADRMNTERRSQMAREYAYKPVWFLHGEDIASAIRATGKESER